MAETDRGHATLTPEDFVERRGTFPQNLSSQLNRLSQNLESLANTESGRELGSPEVIHSVAGELRQCAGAVHIGIVAIELERELIEAGLLSVPAKDERIFTYTGISVFNEGAPEKPTEDLQSALRGEQAYLQRIIHGLQQIDPDVHTRQLSLSYYALRMSDDTSETRKHIMSLSESQLRDVIIARLETAHRDCNNSDEAQRVLTRYFALQSELRLRRRQAEQAQREALATGLFTHRKDLANGLQVLLEGGDARNFGTPQETQSLISALRIDERSLRVALAAAALARNLGVDQPSYRYRYVAISNVRLGEEQIFVQRLQRATDQQQALLMRVSERLIHMSPQERQEHVDLLRDLTRRAVGDEYYEANFAEVPSQGLGALINSMVDRVVVELAYTRNAFGLRGITQDTLGAILLRLHTPPNVDMTSHGAYSATPLRLTGYPNMARPIRSGEPRQTAPVTVDPGNPGPLTRDEQAVYDLATGFLSTLGSGSEREIFSKVFRRDDGQPLTRDDIDAIRRMVTYPTKLRQILESITNGNAPFTLVSKLSRVVRVRHPAQPPTTILK